jgi:hypothetical protein
MLFDWRHPRPIGVDTTSDLYLADGASRSDAQRYRRKFHHDAFNQRIAISAKRFDTAMNDKPTNRLANLDSNRSIAVSNDAI